MRIFLYIIPVLVLTLGITWLLTGKNPLSKTLQKSQNVILIHGFDDGKDSFRTLSNNLKRQGYFVYVLGYNPYTKNWDDILFSLNQQIDSRIDTALTTHVITHSVGSVVYRKLLTQRASTFTGKTLFITPVNVYSPMVDSVMTTFGFAEAKSSVLYNTLLKSNELQQLPLPDTFGIIAGNKSAFGVADDLSVGENDGVVTVQSTEMVGMRDFTVIADDHSLIRYNGKLSKEVIHFLDKGVFRDSQRNQFLFALE